MSISGRLIDSIISGLWNDKTQKDLCISFEEMMNIEKSKTGDHTQIAALHQKHINTGFLSSIGLPFLRLLYTAMTTSNNAFCFVAREEGAIIGFISDAINIGAFYKNLLKSIFLRQVSFSFRKY